jgi:hypothetical protein
VIASWSREWNCGNKCKKKGSGGWYFDRDNLYSKADESHRVHCHPCRNKMLHRSLADMRKVSAQQEAIKQAETNRKAQARMSAFGTGLVIGKTLLVIAGGALGIPVPTGA